MSMLNENPAVGREAQKAATRKTIIATAKRLFLKQGYDATTTRHIADEAGVAIGTVFAHFPEKSLLLREVLSSDIAQLLEQVRPSLPAAAGGVEALICYASRLIPHYLNTPDLSRTLLRSVLFDRDGYLPQLELFVAEIADRLHLDAPSLPAGSRLAVGEVLVANYLFAVVEVLGSECVSGEAVLERLQARCRLVIQGYGTKP
jgi:AcrR family transcriptional regulator